MNVLAVDLITFAVVWAAGFGSRAAWLARGERRVPAVWFVLGAVLGPIALAILQVAPPGTCAACLSPVAGWSFVCSACGRDVREVPELLRDREALPAGDAVAWPAPVPAVGEETRQAWLAVGPGRPTGTVPSPRTKRAVTRSRTVVDPMRPIRLASAVFLEGSVPLHPGTWYQLTSQGGDLRISGPVSALPNYEAVSRPLTGIKMSKTGDRLVVTGVSESLAGFRLVFTSTQDWTSRGIAREVNARRKALGVDTAPPDR